MMPLSLACYNDSCRDPALASLAVVSETPSFQDSGINKLGSRPVSVFLPLTVCCSPHLLTFFVPAENSRYFSSTSWLPPSPCIYGIFWFFCKGCHLKRHTVLIKAPEFIHIHQVSRWPQLFSRLIFHSISLSVHLFYLNFHLCEKLSSWPFFNNFIDWIITLLTLCQKPYQPMKSAYASKVNKQRFLLVMILLLVGCPSVGDKTSVLSSSLSIFFAFRTKKSQFREKN